MWKVIDVEWLELVWIVKRMVKRRIVRRREERFGMGMMLEGVRMVG